MIETGMVRFKNTINVAMKNLIDTIFGIIFFWLIGYGLMFGSDYSGFIGLDGFAIDGKDLKENASSKQCLPRPLRLSSPVRLRRE